MARPDLLHCGRGLLGVPRVPPGVLGFRGGGAVSCGQLAVTLRSVVTLNTTLESVFIVIS